MREACLRITFPNTPLSNVFQQDCLIWSGGWKAKEEQRAEKRAVARDKPATEKKRTGMKTEAQRHEGLD